MDIEKDVSQKNKTNKTLLRHEKPIYSIQRSDETQPQFIIRKLMNRKVEKPSIGKIQRSPLFDRLRLLMPQIKKANQCINPVQDAIDVNLEKCESSSEQYQQGEQQYQQTEQNTVPDIKICGNGDVQINILRYEIPQKKLQEVIVKPNTMIQEIHQRQ